MSTNTIAPITTRLRQLPVLEGPFPKLDFDQLSPNSPQSAFQTWLDHAIESGVKEPHAMTLSTVDEQGFPDARVLILKNVDERGWHFAIKGNSPKGRQLDANAHVSLTFYWPQVGRQIRIRGSATLLPEAECVQDFAARPVKSRASAMASKQSLVLRDRDELLARVACVESAMAEDGQDLEMDGSLGWKVYAVAPAAVEFWQASQDRLHYRLRYKPAPGRDGESESWVNELLWP